ncbi:pentatricopeptide repeat-containing protein [Citrus sinensis]|uniref:Pentatricopeptide repeat-containing protein n=1 Tax=Citrus sinensis TaxID=2711 RepID=A0ACB8I655_CITSI|nr:pentatricopeptide repeat-containing protein [Citrus sinensis]
MSNPKRDGPKLQTGRRPLTENATKTRYLEAIVTIPFTKASQNQSFGPDEDFVIPSLASWVESLKLNEQSRISSHALSEDHETDVDKVSEILRKRYPSPDKVVEALKCFCFTWAKTQTGYMHTPETYNAMVEALGKSKKFGLMWELVKEIDELSNGYVSLAAMSTVMRRLVRGVQKDTRAMSVLMDTLVKRNSVAHAYKVFLKFKDCISLSSQIFDVLIHGWCKTRKSDYAQKAMKEMFQHGFSPDGVSYTCFIEHYCRVKDFRKVDYTLKEMQEKGCKPSVITYTIVMHALEKAKQIYEALKVYEKMKSDDCLTDTSFYSSLIFILSKAEGNALKLLQKIEEDSCKPDCETHARSLKMCCHKKRMKGIVPQESTHKMLAEELEKKSLGNAKERIDELLTHATEQRTF